MISLNFDLNQDAAVDRLDYTHYVETVLNTSLGDANLDGQFDAVDLVQVLARGAYADLIPNNSGWSDGDWNGDGEFDSEDLVAAFAAGGFTTSTAASRPIAPHVAAAIAAFHDASDRPNYDRSAR